MKRKVKVEYWKTTAMNDWTVAGHLFEKGDYSYALFFGHLTLEKLLKALYVFQTGETPPMTHRLVHLAEKNGLDLTENQLELLEIATDFNMEARYPDEKFSFQQKCTKDFTNRYLKQIEEMKEWLIQKIS
ncbi:MAG: HEPN domain-containing protein [Desulfohalobiaceae bacterium]